MGEDESEQRPKRLVDVEALEDEGGPEDMVRRERVCQAAVGLERTRLCVGGGRVGYLRDLNRSRRRRDRARWMRLVVRGKPLCVSLVPGFVTLTSSRRPLDPIAEPSQETSVYHCLFVIFQGDMMAY